MSLSGNNNSSGSAGGRSSFFETFHAPNFGDETFEVQPVAVNQPLKTYSRQPRSSKTTDSSSSLQSLNREEQGAEGEEDELLDEEEEEVSSSENAETTLWMSCSPGRDFTDEEEEDEDGFAEAPQEMEDELEEEGEEEEKQEDDESSDDDDDDGLPLSKLAGKRFLDRGSTHHGAKRLKRNKDSKTRKEEKPLKSPPTAYGYFFSDTQNAIKSQNPQATFGEISKIVASMWDRLGEELKEEYVRRGDESKKEYFKKLAELQTLNQDKVGLPAKSKPKKTKKLSLPQKSKRKLPESEAHLQHQDGSEGLSFNADNTDNENNTDSRHGTDNVDGIDSASFDNSRKSASPKNEETEEKPKPICNYTKCQNPAVDDPRWEFNYCSPRCVVIHCKDVFKAWVANRKTAYCET